MSCPRCGHGRYREEEGCERCGYNTVAVPLRVVDKRTPYTRTDASLPVTTQALRAGNLIGQGRYRLVEQIRVSVDVGIVWLATDLMSSERGRVEIREVELPTYTEANQEQLLRALTSRMIQLGQHVGLPATLGAFHEDKKYYLVFQHIEGTSLSAHLRRKGGALPERTVAEYGRQLCDILSFFSRQQPRFVHGNISPDNILVSLDEQHVTLVNLPLSVVETTRVRGRGNAGYYAPEQTRSDGQSSPSSDLFSVAATMHHAVTGYSPSERMAFFYPLARRLNPNVSQGMEEILAKELLLSVAQRYARAVDMQVELTALLATYPPPGLEHFEVILPSTRQQELTTTQLRELSHNRSLVTYGIVAIGLLLLVLAVLTPIVLPLLNTTSTTTHLASKNTMQQQQAALKTELALEQQTFNAKGIGLSDGRFALDVYGRLDTVLKQQAAQAIQQGHLGSAVNLLTQTVLTDPTDAEAQIYNENVHILQSGAPYVTLVLGVAIDKNIVDQLAARADMQGAFIAQNEINRNSMLPRGLKLRLLIDSSGTDRADIATVTQFVADRVVKAGNQDNIVGVVGWPFSSQTIDARDIIASAHIPMISPTSSSIQLSGSSPYFFRVNPPDDQQGKTLGTVAVSQLHAKKILVLRDPTEAYSVSLANAFALSAQALGSATINNTFTTSKTTVPEYEKLVNDGLIQRADLVFIAGFDVDAVRIAHAVGNIGRLYASYSQLHVLGGDALDTALVLGQGGGPDAQMAAAYPQDMRRLIFSAFGHPDEWTFNAIPKDKQPAFFADWVATYESSSDPALNAPAAGNNAILTADALRVLIQAVISVPGTITGQKIRDALIALGHGGVPAYQGVSGRILFDAQGNPVDKALVVLSIAPDNKGMNAITLTQVVGKFM